MKGTDLKSMQDSGAYGVWKQGKQIALEGYIDFILEHKDAWTTVINLDVIPGRPGETPTEAETERAAEEGWENYCELERALAPHGITPLHVFHRGENFKWLKRLVDECEYFGLAPKTDGGTAVKMNWLDRCMKYVTDNKGMPIRNLHGFAVTAPELIQRFPWTSVDSASWAWAGKNGGCKIPRFGNVVFAAESSFRLEHFDTYSRLKREEIAQYLASKGVPDPRMLRDNYCLTCGTAFEWTHMTCCSEPQLNHAAAKRDAINIEYYLDLDTKMRPWRRS